jgi:hypothetical protein
VGQFKDEPEARGHEDREQEQGEEAQHHQARFLISSRTPTESLFGSLMPFA